MRAHEGLRIQGVDRFIEAKLEARGFSRDACAPCAALELTRIARENLLGRAAVDIDELVDRAIGEGTMRYSSYWVKNQWRFKGSDIRNALDNILAQRKNEASAQVNADPVTGL